MNRGSGVTSILVTLSGGFGLGVSAMQYFLVPLRAHELGATSVEIGLIVATGSLVQALLSIPLGHVTDRVGARRGFALGAGGVAAAASLGGLAADFWWLLVAHALFGGARTWGWIASQSFMAGHGARAELLRRSGRFGFVAGLAALGGPALIGVVASNVSFRAGFFVIATTAIAFLSIALFLPEQKLRVRPMQCQSARTSFMPPTFLRQSEVRSGILLSAVDLWIHTIWVAFVPVALLEAGLAAAVIGTVVSAKAVGATVGSLFTQHVDRMPLPRGIVGGLLLASAATGLGLSGTVVSLPEAYLVAVLVGIAGGIITPLSIALVSEGAGVRRTTALGLRATTNQVSATVGPLAMGEILAATTVATAFPIAAGIAGAVLALGLAGPLRGDRSTSRSCAQSRG